MVRAWLPDAPEPLVDDGTAAATGFTAIGLRTAWPRLSVHVIAPNVHWFSGASVRVIVSLNVRDCNGGTVILPSLTVTLVPAGVSMVALYCDACRARCS